LEQAVIPSPDDQLAFLSKLQRLFAEGDFTATYKYALLIAMSDLAVEVGRDDDSTLRLTHQSLARKFAVCTAWRKLWLQRHVTDPARRNRRKTPNRPDSQPTRGRLPFASAMGSPALPLVDPLGEAVAASAACGRDPDPGAALGGGASCDAACSACARSSSHCVGGRLASRMTVLRLTETPASRSARRIVSYV
jgi:hypothetical protein